MKLLEDKKMVKKILTIKSQINRALIKSGINWKQKGSDNKEEISVVDLMALAIKYPSVFPKKTLADVNEFKKAFAEEVYEECLNNLD